ncbi:MAG: hypothetical protein GEU79_15575 [Acidimicrobiia bacterium]|nr:hypothetical protein [Acidimicrobiia bacterium]
MIDAIIGAVAVFALYRGWRQGLVRQVLNLAGLVLSIFAAFALSRPVADFLVDRVGIGAEISRIVAPVLIFIAVGLAAAVVERILRPIVNLPVLGLANHIGGLAVAAAILILVLTLLVTVARVFPGGADLVDDSRVLSAVAAEEGIANRLLATLSVDETLQRIGSLRDIFDDEVRAVPVGRQSLSIPQSRTDELSPDGAEAQRVAASLNVTRQRAGVGPLTPSEGLAALARDHAYEMATGGYLSRVSPVNGTIEDRFAAAGLPWVRSQIAVGMGATARAVEAAFAETTPVKRMSTAPHFDRVGVAVLNGSHGIIVVMVFGG